MTGTQYVNRSLLLHETADFFLEAAELDGEKFSNLYRTDHDWRSVIDYMFSTPEETAFEIERHKGKSEAILYLAKLLAIQSALGNNYDAD